MGTVGSNPTPSAKHAGSRAKHAGSRVDAEEDALIMRIAIDADLCTGSGMCALVAPAVFELPQGTTLAVVLIERTDDPRSFGRAQEAAGASPTGAITVTPDD
jgi:ferredoxin